MLRYELQPPFLRLPTAHKAGGHRIQNDLTQFHLDLVLPAVVHQGDRALWSSCPVCAGATYHRTVQCHADHRPRLFTDALDGDVVEGLAIAVVDLA